MKKRGVFILFLFLISIIIQTTFGCIDLVDEGVYLNNTDVCNKVYFLDNGIKIHGNDFIFDCHGAVIRGNYFQKSGVTLINSNNVTIQNCNILFYDVGINVQNSKNAQLKNNHLIKNNFGTKFFGSEDSFVYGADVSLKSPLKIAGSKNNYINYFNKVIETSLCSDNECNKPLYISEENKNFDYTPKYISWINPFFR